MKKLLSLLATWFRKPPRPKSDPRDRPACLVADAPAAGIVGQAIFGPIFARLGNGWVIRELTLLHVCQGATKIRTARYLVGPGAMPGAGAGAGPSDRNP